MNLAIYNQSNATPDMKLLVQNWYNTSGDDTDASFSSLVFNDTAVPNLWKSPTSNPDESTLYNVVVKKSCRSCHATRDPSDNTFNKNINWLSYPSLNKDSALAWSLTCNPGTMTNPANHLMPNAQRTFARFWLSTNPNQPNKLAGSDLSYFFKVRPTCK